MLQQMTGDTRTLTNAIEGIRYLGGGTTAASAAQAYWLTLGYAMEGVRHLPGRKAIVLFSEHPGEPGPWDLAKNEAARSAHLAGAAVYPVNPLAAANDGDAATGALASLARDTGGSFGSDFAGVLRNEQGYYAIGFRAGSTVRRCYGGRSVYGAGGIESPAAGRGIALACGFPQSAAAVRRCAAAGAYRTCTPSAGITVRSVRHSHPRDRPLLGRAAGNSGSGRNSVFRRQGRHGDPRFAGHLSWRGAVESGGVRGRWTCHGSPGEHQHVHAATCRLSLRVRERGADHLSNPAAEAGWMADSRGGGRWRQRSHGPRDAVSRNPQSQTRRAGAFRSDVGGHQQSAGIAGRPGDANF